MTGPLCTTCRWYQAPPRASHAAMCTHPSTLSPVDGSVIAVCGWERSRPHPDGCAPSGRNWEMPLDVPGYKPPEDYWEGRARRYDDTRLRVWLRKARAWVRDPWNQTHLFVLGVVLPVVLALIWWETGP